MVVQILVTQIPTLPAETFLDLFQSKNSHPTYRRWFGSLFSENTPPTHRRGFESILVQTQSILFKSMHSTHTKWFGSILVRNPILLCFRSSLVKKKTPVLPTTVSLDLFWSENTNRDRWWFESILIQYNTLSTHRTQFGTYLVKNKHLSYY